MSPEFVARLNRNLTRFATDFGAHPSIADIGLILDKGIPVIRVIGLVAAPPSNLPRGFSMKMRDGSTFLLKIQWHFVANPSDKQMWKGDSPVVQRVVQTIKDPGGHAPVLVSEQKIPEPTEPDQEHLSLAARLPGFVNPNFWGKPWDDHGATVCIARYETWYVLYSLKVPSDSMIIVTGISYQFDDNLQLNDQFEVRVSRDSDNLCQYFDAYVSAAADPAEKYAFSGHYRKAPLYCRFDHDETIVVSVNVRGAYPFTHTGAELLGGCGQIFISGWMSSLMDTRDGGARPSDFGEFNRVALGE